MDLKSALKDILPLLTLKVKHKEKWVIERPTEFHECRCGEMVDVRIIDVSIITCSDSFAEGLVKKFGKWCKIHSAVEVIELSKTSKPCVKCYRWCISGAKGGECWTCRHNPWCEQPPLMIRKRPWFIALKDKDES